MYQTLDACISTHSQQAEVHACAVMQGLRAGGSSSRSAQQAYLYRTCVRPILNGASSSKPKTWICKARGTHSQPMHEAWRLPPKHTCFLAEL